MTIKAENNAQSIQSSTESTADILKNISAQDFLGLGVHDIAYIRPVDVNGTTHYAIHAADGTPLSVMEDKNTAMGTIFQNDLDAVTLH